MFSNLVLVVHVVVAVAIVILVLLQHGKGADMGAAFGSGSAGSLFGSSGAANFLSRSTAVCAGVFFVTCLLLTYNYTPRASGGVMGGSVVETKQDPAKKDAAPATAPAAPANAPATPAEPAKSPEIPK